MLALLGPAVDGVVITRAPSAPPERAWSLEEAAAWASARGLGVQAVPDLDAALAAAREKAGTVLVTGSFHTVGDAMARLPGLAPLG
jgi:dihydrofolate synthase/folylpolyglutamate synthase